MNSKVRMHDHKTLKLVSLGELYCEKVQCEIKYKRKRKMQFGRFYRVIRESPSTEKLNILGVVGNC